MPNDNRQLLPKNPAYVVSGAKVYCKASKASSFSIAPQSNPGLYHTKAEFRAPENRNFLVQESIAGVTADTVYGVNIVGDFGVCKKIGEKCKPDFLDEWFQETLLNDTMLRYANPNLPEGYANYVTQKKLDYILEQNQKTEDTLLNYLGIYQKWNADQKNELMSMAEYYSQSRIQTPDYVPPVIQNVHIGVDDNHVNMIEYLERKLEANKPNWFSSQEKKDAYASAQKELEKARLALSLLHGHIKEYKEYPLLTTDAILICNNGGAIHFADSGQARAQAEIEKKRKKEAMLADLRARVRAALLAYYEQREGPYNDACMALKLFEMEDVTQTGYIPEEAPYKLLAWLIFLQEYSDLDMAQLREQVENEEYVDVEVMPGDIAKFSDSAFKKHTNAIKQDAYLIPVQHTMPTGDGTSGRMVTQGFKALEYALWWLDQGQTSPSYYVHKGVDFGYGGTVCAPLSGPATNDSTSAYSTRGNYVGITIQNGNYVFLQHLASFYRGEAGDDYFVLAGRRVGDAGKTGVSAGIHLHYEIQSGGTPIEPYQKGVYVPSNTGLAENHDIKVPVSWETKAPTAKEMETERAKLG